MIAGRHMRIIDEVSEGSDAEWFKEVFHK